VAGGGLMGLQPEPPTRHQSAGRDAGAAPGQSGPGPIQSSESRAGQVARLRKLLAEPDGWSHWGRGRSLAAVAAAAILCPLPQTQLARLRRRKSWRRAPIRWRRRQQWVRWSVGSVPAPDTVGPGPDVRGSRR
jgi:hypothetical protein